MANKSISQLTASVADLTATDVLPVVQTAGVGPVKMTGTQIKTGIIGPGSVSVASGKTFTASNTLTLAGTDSTTMTFPSTNATIARTDAAQTFSGSQSITNGANPIQTTLDINAGTNVTGTTISGVQITGTAGQFSCNATTLIVGQSLTISGTLGGTGSITGYTNPATYRISATNGSTTFTLVNATSYAALTTTAGTPTGLTYTLSSPAIDINITPNNSDIAYTGIRYNLNGLTSSSASALLDLKLAGSSVFRVARGGTLNTSGAISIIAGNTVNWGDTFIGRAAAATVLFGAADAAAPVAQTLQVQSVVAGTSNTAGVNFTINGSRGTGTGVGGSILFQVAPAGGSGTAQNAYSTALTIAATKVITFADTYDLAFSGTTGSKIGTATSQKIAFWNATPIVQPTTAVAAATVAATGAGDVVAASTTFDGYTIPQVVKALRNAGLLA